MEKTSIPFQRFMQFCILCLQYCNFSTSKFSIFKKLKKKVKKSIVRITISFTDSTPLHKIFFPIILKKVKDVMRSRNKLLEKKWNMSHDD